MKIKITEIQKHEDGVEIKAVVFSRNFPRPLKDETDKQYARRIQPIVDDMNSYSNLHIGWADMCQPIEMEQVPKVDEYDS